MASQMAMITETIAGMKRALARRDDASDSDETIAEVSNRGNKLKRKARFVHEGQLDLPNGPRVYRRKVDHAGYQRYTISRNPPRLDEDGEELDDDDIDEEADVAAAEENPYAGIRLEHILAPLTSAAELPNHPTLSVPFLSNSLSKLTEQAAEVERREKAALWRMKQLLTKFRGDETWAPCGLMRTDNDEQLFVGPPYAHIQPSRPRIDKRQNGGESAVVPREQQNASPAAEVEIKLVSTDVIMVMDGPHAVETPRREDQDVPNNESVAPGEPSLDSSDTQDHANPDGELAVTTDQPGPDETNDLFQSTVEGNLSAVSKPERETTPPPDEVHPMALDNPSTGPPEERVDEPRPPSVPNETAEVNGDRQDEPNGNDDSEADAQAPAHRMKTRAQTQAASENVTSRTVSPPDPSPTTFIHPLFTIPPSALPDRDFGLPPAEAEETRRLLMLYVQKQEEVCRGALRLYEDLLRADRLRRTVWKWAKAEAHVGEMSDGEDWYDKEEWGLEEELKKGHEEDEDDVATQGKKTRARRA